MDIKERIVIKIGTNVMTNSRNRIVLPFLKQIVAQVAELYERGIICALVSSGSVIAGKEVLRKSSVEDKTIRRQVYSSIGQPRMMRKYYNIFHEYGMTCAQVLPTKQDFMPGIHRKNMINCYEGLIQDGVIAIANEDDTVSVTDRMFTDNDELAGLLAELIGATKLIILTDIEGVYTGDPSHNHTEVIQKMSVHDNVDQFIVDKEKGEAEGRGGMGSKINIAKKSAANNITTYIANGKRPNVIVDIIDGHNVGTKITV